MYAGVGRLAPQIAGYQLALAGQDKYMNNIFTKNKKTLNYYYFKINKTKKFSDLINYTALTDILNLLI